MMTTEFIGSIVTVTLIEPRNTQVRGFVKGITAGQQLDLKDGESGAQVVEISIRVC